MQNTSPLYPAIDPYIVGRLETGDGHNLYWEISGNKKGIPVIFLHGGPGSGTSPYQRQFFNPDKYKIILFDQRGSGKSRPHASLENNTTFHLISDIELLRKYLDIGKWAVFGGSWGSTLALAYAHKYADKILALVMYGIFLARPGELRDFYFEGSVVSKIFPDIFKPYIELLEVSKRHDPIRGYKELFQSDDKNIRQKALDLWTRLEKCASNLVGNAQALQSAMNSSDYVLAHSLLENHYFLNHGFIDGDALLQNIGVKTKNFPVHIIQGRYDLICPFVTAYELYRSIPHSVLHILDDVGHSAADPKMQKKIVEVLDLLTCNNLNYH